MSDYGGKAEVTDPTETGSTCASYGGPFCIYPWFTKNSDGSLSYGVNYPSTVKTTEGEPVRTGDPCDGPFGPDTLYCATVIH